MTFLKQNWLKISLVIILSFFVFWMRSQFNQINGNITRLNDKIKLIDNRLEKTEKDTLSLKDQGYVERSDLNLVASKITPSVVFILGTDNTTSYNEGEKIITDTSINTNISGTGFFISGNGYIATAKHVITNLDKNNIRVKDYKGVIYRANLFVEGEKSDIAILKIEGTSFDSVELGSFQNIQVGEEIGLIGFNPGFSIPLIHKGNISGKGFENGVKIFTINSFVNKGNSGSPIFSLLTGRVIGILNARTPEVSNRNPIDINKINSGFTAGGIDPMRWTAQLYNDMLQFVTEASQIGIGISTSTDEIRKLINF